MIKLRPYQQAAVNSVYDSLRNRDDNPCVVIPTGGGKTPVIAQICKDSVGEWNGRVLILAHVKELLKQAADKLRNICPDINVGVYSSGLGSRDTSNSVIIGGIQSVHRKAEELGHFDLVLVDEAHLIPEDGNGMYRKFLADLAEINPNIRIAGLTATPYRMKTGEICGPENILNHVCYEIGIPDLIDMGFLSKLVTKGSKNRLNIADLHVRAGEFMANEVEDLMNQKDLVSEACSEIADHMQGRKACLIFAASIDHAKNIADVLRKKYNASVDTIFGDTLNFIRDNTLQKFKDGDLKYIVNVNVLTTGFDAPNIDCVVLLRPTLSPGLYYQMVGRGFRTHPGKEDCLILDFAENVPRHGPVDNIYIEKKNSGKNKPGEAPVKMCPLCKTYVHISATVCVECDHEFPVDEKPKHHARAGNEGILSGETTFEEHEVKETNYSQHTKRGAEEGAPTTMRVDYKINWTFSKSEWVCFEHSGYARAKAVAWWKARSQAKVPSTTEEAVELAESGALAETTGITIKTIEGEQYDSISKYVIGDIPPWREPGGDDDIDETEAEQNERQATSMFQPDFSEEDVPF